MPLTPESPLCPSCKILFRVLAMNVMHSQEHNLISNRERSLDNYSHSSQQGAPSALLWRLLDGEEVERGSSGSRDKHRSPLHMGLISVGEGIG